MSFAARLTIAALALLAPTLAVAPGTLAQDTQPPANDAEAARAAAAAGEPSARVGVRVRGGNHESYGRLVFDWDEKVEYRVGKEGDDLHVAFSRPATFDTEPTMPALRDYVGQPAPGPHGYRIVFPMKDVFQVEDWRYGTKVVVDLKKIAEPTPAELTRRPPVVRVRTGQHDGYGRLVFDWPRPVGYDVRQDAKAGTASVRFRRPARLDLSRFAARPPSQVRGLSPIVASAQSGVDLEIPEGARVRHFTEGAKVVVDVMAPDKPRPDRPKPTETAKTDAEPAARQAAAPAPEPEPRTEQETESTTAEAAPAPRERPGTPEPVETAELKDEAPDAEASDAEGAEPARQTAAATPEAAEGDAADDTSSAKPMGEVATGGGDAPLEILPTPAEKPEGSAARAEADPILDTPRRFRPEQVAQGIVPKPGEMPPAVESATLDLPWAGRTAAAFKHGGQVWSAFAGKAPADLAARIETAGLDVDSVSRGDIDGLTLLRVDADPFLRARPRLEEGLWRLTLAREPALATQPIALETDLDAAQVRLPVEGAGPVVTLKDPASGGRLVVVPVASPGQGIALRRRFPEFTLLATHTGIAVRPHADYVRVRREKAAVVIEGQPQPLMLSAAAGRSGGAPAALDGDGRWLLDLERWRRPDQGFVAAKQTLQRQLADAAPADRPLARLELARFYFAHGMAVETLGALDLYAQEAPRHADDPQVVLMRGASEMLAGDWAEAAGTLNHPALDDVPEALPWQAAYASLSGAHGAAAAAFSKADPLLEPYPPSVRKQLRLWAAESRLARSDVQGAGAELARVREIGPNPAEAAEADVLEARLHALDGAPAKAEDLWRRAAASSHPPSRARARFVLAERGLVDGTRDRREVIEELERLRFAWRGDEFEAVLLHRLADLYVEAGRYGRALAALRQAASHLPDSPLARRAAARMRVLFASLFLDGVADRMPPLKALALYESYRELTPAGPRGDEMIEHLADRLVGVDLLTRAGKLLEDQVRHRLDGRERAETGARLAAIRLLDRKPGKAIAALDLSAEPELPRPVAEKRRHLRARALAEVGKPDEALGLLSGDDSAAGLELAADIHSERGDWVAAADALGRLLPAAPADSGELGEAEARRVMRAAVAMTLAGRTQGLMALSQRYGRAMADSPHAETFALLDPSTGGGPVTVAKQLAEVQQAKAFMSSFRDRLEAGSTADGE